MNSKAKYFAPIFLFTAAAMACISAKPIYYADDKAVAIKAVEKVHQLYNDEKYEEILQMFVPRKEQNPGERERFFESMKKNYAERGKIIGYHETKYQITPQSNHRELLFMFRTDFEKGTHGEGYVILVNGEEAVLDGYFQTDGQPAPPANK